MTPIEKKRNIYVKPVTNKTDVFGFITLELTKTEDFLDDWRRYGIKIALYNLIWQLRNK